MALIFPALSGLAWSVTKTPTFQTRIQRAVSGRELRALDYPYPLWQFALVYDFLRDNPLETGCLSCRFMDQTDASGRTLSKSFAAALFLTMKHLEDWTWTHSTHRAIFQSFHELVKARDFKLDLKLWHEVFVLRAAASRFEYLNCHPGTGLLPFLPAVPSAA